MLAAALVLGVLLMAGPLASTAAGPGDPMSGMVTMAGPAPDAGLLVPGAPASDGVLVTACAAMCGDLLEACLVVLVLVVAALAGPGAFGRGRAGPRSRGSGRTGPWATGESPPWSVPSLSQLSVLRV